jgi:ketosteroid isomerase-like protein
MKTKYVFTGCFALLSLAFVGAISAADTKHIEQDLRDLHGQCSAAAAAKDLDKLVSFYSDDAVVLPANAPIATAKEAIRSLWKDLLASGVTIDSKPPTRVEVSRSGDMAWARGIYEVTTKDASGKPVNGRGKYVVIWKKQPDGNWRCVADIWNSDLPAAAPAPVEGK